MKPISARASQDPQVVDRLFGTPERARLTARALLAAQAAGQDRFQAHGLVLVRRKRVVVIQSSR